MAILYPAQLDPATKSGGERRLYEIFASQLSDEWVVFHSLAHLNLHREFVQEGEADFIIAHARLGVLVIEVKGGMVRYDPVLGHYTSRDKSGEEHDIGDPFGQASANKHWLINFISDKPGWPTTRVVFGHAVAFPDVSIEADLLRPNAPRDIIIDDGDLANVEERLGDILHSWQGNDQPPGVVAVKVLEHYLGQSADICHPFLGNRLQADQQEFLRLTDEQFDILGALETNRRAIVRGCAGSGKTLLAVEKARRLAEQGQRVLYVCFNEALASYIAQDLAYLKLFNVFSYYRLVQYWGERASIHIQKYRTPEVGQDFFDSDLPDFLLDAVSKIGPQYDAIIVDELQDFNKKWWDSLFWLLENPTEDTFYAFGDQNQRIFPPPLGQIGFPVYSGFIDFRLTNNCRNTRAIAAAVERFYDQIKPLKAKGPTGLPVEVVYYKTFLEMRDHLRRLLHRLVHDEKVSTEDIAILTVRRSRKADENLPGPPTEISEIQLGNFQLVGNMHPETLQILSKSIYSFKGLERPVIIVGEIDDQIPDAILEKLLYTAVSRAKSHLILLVKDSTSAAILNRLSS